LAGCESALSEEVVDETMRSVRLYGAAVLLLRARKARLGRGLFTGRFCGANFFGWIEDILRDDSNAA